MKRQSRFARPGWTSEMNRIANVQISSGSFSQHTYMRCKNELLTSHGDNIVVTIRNDFGLYDFYIFPSSHDSYSLFAKRTLLAGCPRLNRNAFFNPH
jgi:hypothetical protein